MTTPQSPPDRHGVGKRHEFAKLPAFDEAMRKLVNVPKEAVEKREKAEVVML